MINTGKNPSISLSIRVINIFENLGIFIMMLIVVIVTSIIQPRFMTLVNLSNIMINSSIMAVTGYGMTLAIVIKGLDLSVGSTQVLSASIIASLLAIVPMPIAILAGLLVGLFIGIGNGLVITKFNVPPFVATLGMMSIIRGVALLYTKGQSILIYRNEYGILNTGKVLKFIPVPFLIALGVLAVLYVLLRHTPFGRHVVALGGNEMAAVSAGLKINNIAIAVYGLVGLTAGLSGMMLSSQLMRINATVGIGFELKVIAVTILGGTSLSGGKGNVPGVLIAALFLAVISGALNILNIPSFYQYLSLGVLLIFAVALDNLRNSLMAQILRK